MYLFILSEPNLGITSVPRDKSRANTRLCLLGLGDSQMVKCLPSKHKDLSLIPKTHM